LDVNFVPIHTEILVSSLTQKEVARRLDIMTTEVNYLDLQDYNYEQKFNGKVNRNSFHLSLKVDKSDAFLPLIKGKIEGTPSGSILFITYSLFPSAVFFIYFWMIIAMFMGAYFAFFEAKLLFAFVSLFLGLGNLGFAWSQFNRKVKRSQHVFHKMLDLQNKD
jgi:hypothetical protein